MVPKALRAVVLCPDTHLLQEAGACQGGCPPPSTRSLCAPWQPHRAWIKKTRPQMLEDRLLTRKALVFGRRVAATRKRLKEREGAQGRELAARPGTAPPPSAARPGTAPPAPAQLGRAQPLRRGAACPLPGQLGAAAARSAPGRREPHSSLRQGGC